MADELTLNPAYPPLLTEEASIRVATLCSGSEDGQLSFTTTVQPLGGFPQNYIALSYTGIVSYDDHSPRGYTEVTLNDQTVLISTELLRFLWKLADLDKTGPFWCDGLCINQNDLQEKNDQVSLMTQIFYNAKSVWAWLGEADERAETILGVMAHWVHDHPGDELLGKEELRLVLEDFAMPSETFEEGLFSLFNRIYWTRVWIVQEICFGSDVVFFCGNYWMPWAQLRIFSKKFSSEASIEEMHIENLIGSIPGAVVLDLKKSRKAIGIGDMAGKFLLAELVSLLKDFHATDPRDKLFALHAMSHEFHRKSIAFKPDYTKSRESLLWSCLFEAECPDELWLVAGSGLIKALDLGSHFRCRQSCSSVANRNFYVSVYSHANLHIFCDQCVSQPPERDKWTSTSNKLGLDMALGSYTDFKRPKPHNKLWPFEVLNTGIVLWARWPRDVRGNEIDLADGDDPDNRLYKTTTVTNVEIRIPDLQAKVNAPRSDPMPSLDELNGVSIKIFRTRYYNTMRSFCELSVIQYAALLDFYCWIWRNLESRGRTEPLIGAFEIKGDSVTGCWEVNKKKSDIMQWAKNMFS